jgi:hypothetical protein
MNVNDRLVVIETKLIYFEKLMYGALTLITASLGLNVTGVI